MHENEKNGNRKVSDIGTGIFAGYPGYRCYSYNTLYFARITYSIAYYMYN